MRNKLRLKTRILSTWDWLWNPSGYTLKTYLDRKKTHVLKERMGEKYWDMTQRDFLNTIV